MAVMAAPFDLTGQVAVITGAGGGLGQCFAHTLAGAGASVVLCGRDANRAELVALEDAIQSEYGKDFTGEGSVCCRVAVDVVSQSSVEAAYSTLDTAGLTPTILVNNAGVARSGEAHTLSEADWNAVVDTNLRGAWAMSQPFAKRLIDKQQSGSVINIASILGLQPSKGTAPYAVSKAGLIQMTRALALEWARYNIRVNALSPGYVETDINRDYLHSDAAQEQIKRIPTRRIGEAHDLSGPLLLLASDAGRHMTGANVVVDGGHSCQSL